MLGLVKENYVSRFGTCSHMPFNVFRVLISIMSYVVNCFLQHMFKWKYVRIIKRNIKTIDNENNHIMKSSILCHITQHINSTTKCRQ